MLKEDDESFYGVAIGDDVAKTSIQAVINACQQQLIPG